MKKNTPKNPNLLTQFSAMAKPIYTLWVQLKNSILILIFPFLKELFSSFDSGQQVQNVH